MKDCNGLRDKNVHVEYRFCGDAKRFDFTEPSEGSTHYKGNELTFKWQESTYNTDMYQIRIYTVDVDVNSLITKSPQDIQNAILYVYDQQRPPAQECAELYDYQTEGFLIDELTPPERQYTTIPQCSWYAGLVVEVYAFKRVRGEYRQQCNTRRAFLLLENISTAPAPLFTTVQQLCGLGPHLLDGNDNVTYMPDYTVNWFNNPSSLLTTTTPDKAFEGRYYYKSFTNYGNQSLYVGYSNTPCSATDKIIRGEYKVSVKKLGAPPAAGTGQIVFAELNKDNNLNTLVTASVTVPASNEPNTLIRWYNEDKTEDFAYNTTNPTNATTRTFSITEPTIVNKYVAYVNDAYCTPTGPLVPITVYAASNNFVADRCSPLTPDPINPYACTNPSSYCELFTTGRFVKPATSSRVFVSENTSSSGWYSPVYPNFDLSQNGPKGGPKACYSNFPPNVISIQFKVDYFNDITVRQNDPLGIQKTHKQHKVVNRTVIKAGLDGADNVCKPTFGPNEMLGGPDNLTPCELTQVCPDETVIMGPAKVPVGLEDYLNRMGVAITWKPTAGLSNPYVINPTIEWADIPAQAGTSVKFTMNMRHPQIKEILASFVPALSDVQANFCQSLFKCEACFPNKNLGAKGSENSSSESLDSTFSQSGKSIQQIAFYPNPTQNKSLTITWTQPFTRSAYLVVYNVLGQRVYSSSLDQNVLSKSIDLSILSPALYYFNIIEGDTIIAHEKITIQ